MIGSGLVRCVRVLEATSMAQHSSASVAAGYTHHIGMRTLPYPYSITESRYHAAHAPPYSPALRRSEGALGYSRGCRNSPRGRGRTLPKRRGVSRDDVASAWSTPSTPLLLPRSC